MRPGGSGRRFRNNRGNSRRTGGGNRNQSFESTGPDVKVRGTAQQIAERYLVLARDASSAGDPVVAENCLQHAEHYQRIVNQFNERAAEQQREREERAERQRAYAPEDEPAADDAASGGEGAAQAIPLMDDDAPRAPRRPRRRTNGAEREAPAAEAEGGPRSTNGAGRDGVPSPEDGRPIAV